MTFTTRYVCGKCGTFFSSLSDKRYLPCASQCGGIGERQGQGEPEVGPAVPRPANAAVEPAAVPPGPAVPATVDALCRALGKAIANDAAAVTKSVRFCIDCWRQLAANDPGGKTRDGFSLCGRCAMADPTALKMVMVRVPADAVAKWPDGRTLDTGGGFIVPLTDDEMEEIEILPRTENTT